MITVAEQRCHENFAIGWLTLDLPAALNALTLDVAQQAFAQLQQWAARPEIVCVVLQGAGRAFCAGGDVRRMRQGILDGDDYCARFFETEYRLDHVIHRYPKPLLVWGHGVVMGGGLGLLVGASHRVVTGSTHMAMPEIGIGLYPDVGASHFLNRLPPGLGLFLGITGCEWNGADALVLDFADYLLDDSQRDILPAHITTLPWTGSASDHAVLDEGLRRLQSANTTPQLLPHVPTLAAACQGGLADAIDALQTLDIAEPWFQRALDNLAHGCPVTARLVEEQLKRGRDMSLAEAFRMEWTLSMQCCAHPDFPEGVRARLVDKDKQPRWRFPSIAAVPADYVQEHFHTSIAKHPLQNLI